MSSLNCYLRFSIVVLETLKFEWQCCQYLELNPTCTDPAELHLQKNQNNEGSFQRQEFSTKYFGESMYKNKFAYAKK